MTRNTIHIIWFLTTFESTLIKEIVLHIAIISNFWGVGIDQAGLI